MSLVINSLETLGDSEPAIDVLFGAGKEDREQKLAWKQFKVFEGSALTAGITIKWIIAKTEGMLKEMTETYKQTLDDMQTKYTEVLVQ